MAPEDETEELRPFFCPDSDVSADDPLYVELFAAIDQGKCEGGPGHHQIPRPTHAAFGHPLSRLSFELARDYPKQQTTVREVRRAEVKAAFAGSDEHALCLAELRTKASMTALMSGVIVPSKPNENAQGDDLDAARATSRRVAHLDAVRAGWEQILEPHALQQMRWDVLGVAIDGLDAVTMRMAWCGLRMRGEEPPCRLRMPDAVRRRVFANATGASVIQILKCAICTCLRPLLAVELMEALEREVEERGASPCRAATLAFDLTEKADLVAMAVAILDGVFATEKKKPREAFSAAHDAWRKAFLPTVPHKRDTAMDASSWKAVTAKLLHHAQDGMPGRLVETLPPQRQNTLGVLQLAVRYCDHDVFFLRQLLSMQKSWSVGSIAEAFVEALSQAHGVRGPNICTVLALLYEKFVLAWKQNETLRAARVAESNDSIGTAWTTIVTCASRYVELDVDATNTLCVPEVGYGAKRRLVVLDTEAWFKIVGAMVTAHEPNPADESSAEWDHSSPLFGSLVKIALCACVGDVGKAHVVSYFLRVSLKSQSPFASMWHEIPRLVQNVVERHQDLFELVVQSMLTDAPAELRASNQERFEEALTDTLIYGQREPVRLLIEALTPFGLPEMIWGNSSRRSKSCLLLEWVACLGHGCRPMKRAQLGADYAAFVNAKVEADFIAVLEGRAWSDGAKTAALARAVDLQRAVVAQVLLRPKYNVALPKNANAWLDAISEFLYRPGNACARAVVENLERQAGEQPGAAASDQPAAKRARAA